MSAKNILPVCISFLAAALLTGCACCAPRSNGCGTAAPASPTSAVENVTISAQEYRSLLAMADSNYVILPRHVYDSITRRNRILEELVVSLRGRLAEEMTEE